MARIKRISRFIAAALGSFCLVMMPLQYGLYEGTDDSRHLNSSIAATIGFIASGVYFQLTADD
jgi:hypothetical protein